MATLYKLVPIGDGLLELVSIEVKPEDGISFHLPELYRMLECDTIEVAYPQNPNYAGKILIIDEEGKLTGKEYNPPASLIYGMEPEDIIVGNALLCEDGELR